MTKMPKVIHKYTFFKSSNYREEKRGDIVQIPKHQAVG